MGLSGIIHKLLRKLFLIDLEVPWWDDRAEDLNEYKMCCLKFNLI